MRHLKRIVLCAVMTAMFTAGAAYLSAQPTTQPSGKPAASGAVKPAPQPTETLVEEKVTEESASEELAAEQNGGGKWFLNIFGPGMWPLWICSIILVALILERRKALKSGKIIDPTMVEEVVGLVSDGKLAEAQKVSEASPTVLGKAWGQGFHEFLLGGPNLAEVLTNSTVLAFKPLKRNLRGLATLGVISPLLGLLGTVVGMIMTFFTIASGQGGADKAALANGIALALFTTAGGLIVAIPAIVSNRYFTARLTGIAEQAEEAINRINYRYAHAVATADEKPAKKNDEEEDA